MLTFNTVKVNLSQRSPMDGPTTRLLELLRASNKCTLFVCETCVSLLHSQCPTKMTRTQLSSCCVHEATVIPVKVTGFCLLDPLFRILGRGNNVSLSSRMVLAVQDYPDYPWRNLTSFQNNISKMFCLCSAKLFQKQKHEPYKDCVKQRSWRSG